MKEFWEEKHRNNALLFLSGHPAAAIIKGLYIEPLVEKLLGKPSEVLEIGVGLGICTQDLHNMGLAVSCLDISEEALRRVEKITARRYFDVGAWCLLPDTFDLAISYCVTQHMNDESLAYQLKYVIRSLKPSGIFAMQYSFPFYGSQIDQGMQQMQAGAVNRPVEKMFQLVSEASGQIVLNRIYGIYPQYSSGWGVIHIVKKEEAKA
jgi:SAM-dependent methyltransferase